MSWEKIKDRYILSLADFDLIESSLGMHAVPIESIKKVIPDLMDELDKFMVGQTRNAEGIYPSDFVRFLEGPFQPRDHEKDMYNLLNLWNRTNQKKKQLK